jgi:YkoY family integral membrane protein
MIILDSIANNFSHFSIPELVEAISNPTNLGIILSLVLIEGLLSSDNALVLAMMVKKLPKEEQKKALFYGILGAYVFRFIAIGLGTVLIKIWWVKLLGAAYLLWLGIKYFIQKNELLKRNIKEKKLSFWRTVLAVELIDISFSLDSILAALGVSNVLWVLLIGAILGILMMRGVANIFIKIISKYPELETTAYILVILIGIKMALTLIHIEISSELFIVFMVLLFGGTFLINKIKNSKKKNI